MSASQAAARDQLKSQARQGDILQVVLIEHRLFLPTPPMIKYLYTMDH